MKFNTSILAHNPMIFNCLFIFLLCLPLHSFAAQLYLQIEHAETETQRKWGLMQRRSLPRDYGMLFSYTKATRPSIWAFNCFIDLAVIFLSQAGVIQEIAILKAYPEVMDPKRPVYDLQGMLLYPPWDPITQFFLKHSVTPTKPCWHVLETSLDSFIRHKIKVGDVVPREFLQFPTTHRNKAQ